MGYRVSRALLRASFFTGITAAAVMTTLGVASAQFGQPEGITKEAEPLHNLYLLVTVMAIIVWALVTGALVFMLIRFKKRSEELPPQIHGNNVLEIIWTGIPIVIVLILFVFSFIVLLDVDDSAADQDEYCEPAEGSINDCILTVDVTGFQFSWIFEYNLQDLGASAEPAEGTVTRKSSSRWMSRSSSYCVRPT
jgi:cytochrome c oxidase subunit II